MDKANNGMNNWIEGIPYELAFWNNLYRWRWTYEGLLSWSNYGKELCLEGIDARSVLLSATTATAATSRSGKPIVLDVGAGMSYAPGNFYLNGTEKQEIDIRYIDPLAFHYNRILKKRHKNLPEVTFGVAEYLSSCVADEADLVIIQNALDHSFAPIKGIIEALRTLHTGGFLYLNHHPNEAETEDYKGFHKFNICEEHGKLIIWNKESRRDVNELLNGFATIDVKTVENGHIVALIKKTAEVPASLYDDKASIRELCHSNHLLFYQVYSGHLSMKLKCSYAFYNFIQFFVQALPHNLKIKLKKLIKQA